MCSLTRLESADPRIAGCLLVWDGKRGVEITWSIRAPIQNTYREARAHITYVIDALKDSGRMHDIQSTNWPSVIAALQKHMDDFNARLLQAITPPTQH